MAVVIDIHPTFYRTEKLGVGMNVDMLGYK